MAFMHKLMGNAMTLVTRCFRIRPLLAFVGLMLSTGTVWAHPGHLTEGFADGLAHPFLGYDHWLTMLAVGLWAVQRRESGDVRALWQLPLVFVCSVALAGMLGVAGPVPATVELGLAVSLLAVGGLLAFAVKLPGLAAPGICAALGLLQGYVHAAEMPQGSAAMTCALGFIVATVLLHGGGLFLALSARALSAHWTLRATGGGLVMLGVHSVFV